MLFHEIYGNYYNVLAQILSEAVSGKLNNKRMQEIILQKGFNESIVNIPEKINEWSLLSDDYNTPLLAEPKMPLTILQKMWLKAIISDPRIQLFEVNMDNFDNIAPLFSYDNIIYYDRNKEGDPYTSQLYIDNFRLIINAINNKDILEFIYTSRRNKDIKITGLPLKMEYSEKDDKFRVNIKTYNDRDDTLYINTLNISGISQCNKCTDNSIISLIGDSSSKIPERQKETITIEVSEDRNALERILLQFSYLEKETKKLSSNLYQVKLTFDAEDETEILIRILSFGPVLRVTSPNSFIEKIRERLSAQIF